MNAQKGKKILVVDDEEDLLEVFQFCLENSGYQVAAASTVDLAVEHIKKENFDLIITDYKMPKSNGLEFLSMALENKSPLPPVILISAFEEILDLEHPEVKITTKLVKPINTDDLVKKVEEILFS